MILGGDIGGTKTHLLLLEEKSGRVLKEEKYSSQSYKSLTDILLQFIEGITLPIEKSCFGIAGPIKDNACVATNLPWIVRAKDIEEELKISKVKLINDLEANAYGIFSLKKEELVCLQKGKAAIGSQALISAGTGLGEAGLIWNGENHVPFACEGGHCDFAPNDETQIDLYRYLNKRFGHVSYERILSGPGILNIYHFVVQTGLEKESPLIASALKTEVPAKVISQAALQSSCAACERAFDLFTTIYGNEAGNLALKFMAVGGLFIGGGIAPKILPLLKEHPNFMKAFTNKGRFKSLLEEIPINIILNENTALLGACECARRIK